MPDLQVGGKAVVWGVPAITMQKGIIVDPATSIGVYITDVNFEHQQDVEETRLPSGDVVNLCFYNQRQQCTISCFPYGATKGAAQTEDNLMPLPGWALGLTDLANSDPMIAGTTETQWLVTAASKQRTNTAKSQWNLTLTKYVGISTYASLAAS